MAAPVTLPAVQTNTTLKFCVIIDLKKAAHFLNFFKKYQTSTRLALLLVDINKKKQLIEEISNFTSYYKNAIHFCIKHTVICQLDGT